MLSFISATSFSLPKLNSFTSATATIYLDFDGQTVSSSLWNGGSPLFCTAPALTDAQITEIFNRVSEDYRPFNVNITTDSVKFLAAPLTQRIRIIVTPTSSWKPGVGGVSFIGSFTWGDDTPGFVFTDRLGPNNTKYIAECCSHESGHTVGLSHQSRYDENCNLIETYNTGSGSGQTSWAPVMGNSYYKNMTGWNDGPTPYGCSAVQDNLSIIVTSNGFTYRTDDYTDVMNTTTYSPSATSFSIDAVISTSTDKDAFRYSLNDYTSIHIDATPYAVGSDNSGANLDIKILLYDATQTLIRTYDPSSSMGVTIDTSLKAGVYYFVLDGTGNSYAGNYGSLGSYTITGFTRALPIQQVSLSGNTENEKHNLNWNISSDEPIQTIEVEYSSNGVTFNSLVAENAGVRNMSYIPSDNNTRYYRLKVTSVLNQIVYSNIIALKSTSVAKPFIVSTLVSNQIQINSNENYQYKLLDANGRVMKTGNGVKGINRIDVYNLSSGFYVIQLFGSTTKQSERIIKQ